jgi:hypothetical protein
MIVNERHCDQASFAGAVGGDLGAVPQLQRVAERMAFNQARFRDANELIEAAARRVDASIRMPFLCECCDRECHERFAVLNQVGLAGDVAEVFDPRRKDGHH